MKEIMPLRYLFLLMGIFATYCGLIYNDFFSLKLDLFGSCYNEDFKKICNYPFGFDPIWEISSNELITSNSFKMKFAVIIGICQMMLGIILKGMNAIHFKQWIDFFHVFLP